MRGGCVVSPDLRQRCRASSVSGEDVTNNGPHHIYWGVVETDTAAPQEDKGVVERAREFGLELHSGVVSAM